MNFLPHSLTPNGSVPTWQCVAPLLIAVLTALTAGLVLWLARALEVRNKVRGEANKLLADHARAARETSERMQAILDAVPVTIMVKDREGRFVFVNQAGLAELALPREAIIGRTIVDIWGPDVVQSASAEKCIYETGETQTFDQVVEMGSGPRTFGVFRFPLRNARGEVHEIGIVGTDVTERQTREQELRREHDRLEVLHGELAVFSASISQELRTPLRAVEGFSRILLEDYATALDATGRDYLLRIRNGSQRMASLLDDLIELSLVTSGNLRRELIDLSELATEVAARLAQRNPAHAVAVETAPDMEAWGDPHLVRQVFESLLGNARKFTAGQPGALITVSSATVGAELVVCVRDNGAGFDMKDKDEIFLPFPRLEATSDHEGTGLGLAVVRRAIARHGGRVWAEGNPGEGAAVYFTLSVRTAPIPQARVNQEVS